jgi:hypothetical protein
MPCGQFKNNALNSLATFFQISMRIVGLFEKVYDGKPSLTIFLERMYNTVVSIMKGIM